MRWNCCLIGCLLNENELNLWYGSRDASAKCRFYLPFWVQNFPFGFDIWFANELARQFDIDAPSNTHDLTEWNDSSRNTAARHQFDNWCALALANARRCRHPCFIRFTRAQILGLVVMVLHQNGAFHNFYLLPFFQNTNVHRVFGDNSVRSSRWQPTNHHGRLADDDRFNTFGWIGHRFLGRARYCRGWTFAGSSERQNL